MSVIEEINVLKNDLIKICDKMEDLQKRGIRIEFQIADMKLARFVALQEMKISS